VFEMLIAVLVIGAVAGLGALTLLPWETLAYASVWLIGIGFAVGIPTGVVYHVWLYKALRPIGLLPDDWYWRPIACNDLVPDEDRGRVLAMCYTAAGGFVIVTGGIVALAAAVAVQFLRP